MVKDILLQIRYGISQLKFNRKKEVIKRLQSSFGKPKDESFDFESIEKYFRKKDNNQAHQILSDKTCVDLDFDDLFMLLDRTHSPIGQQYLYNDLRTIKINEKQMDLNEEIIDELLANTEFRISNQKQLERLHHKDAYFIRSLFQEKHIHPPRWFFAIRVLSLAALGSLILSFFNSIFLMVLLGVFCVNFVIHYWNKNNLAQYVSSIPQLLILHNVASHLYANPLLKRIDPHLSKSIKLVNEVKNRMIFFKLEAKLQGEFEIIAWFLFEIFKTMFLLEPLLLFGVLKRLDHKREEVENIFAFVGHIDMLISIASLRSGAETFCKPSIDSQSHIVAEDLSHPLIFNCTTNSIEISEKSILLTGSNMSGKTSFIRAIGLNVITGLTINTCFAKSMKFPLLKVFSAIRISDDLMNDKSYTQQESKVSH
mgnify:CR=1 FL=1